MQSAMDTRVVDATGNLCDTRVLQGFHRRCEQVLSSGKRRVTLDLANVMSADTKLVATLITLLRRAQLEGVHLKLMVSKRVYGWITVCRVERLLRPTCAHNQAPLDAHRGCPRARGTREKDQCCGTVCGM